MFTADQFVAHAVGDYILQSDWMANAKTKSSVPALCHVVTYTLPFLFLTTAWQALLFIAATHFVIDRWRLARHVIWLKNFMSPPTRVVAFEPTEAVYTVTGPEGVVDGASVSKGDRVLVKSTEPVQTWLFPWWHPWSECTGTGYHKDKPAWLTVWLMIITDNLLHVLCNGLALYWWGA